MRVWTFLPAMALAMIVLIGPPAFAAPAAAARAPSMPGEDGFYFSLGAKALHGTMKSGDGTTIVSRKLVDYAAETVLGYKYASVLLGAGAEYGLWKQLTKPASISDSNTQGTQLAIAAVLGYEFSWVKFVGKYYFSSVYDLDKSDAAGNNISYSSPESSYALQALFQVSGGSHLGLEYGHMEYGKQKAGATTATLNSNTQLNVSTIGVVYAWIY